MAVLTGVSWQTICPPPVPQDSRKLLTASTFFASKATGQLDHSCCTPNKSWLLTLCALFSGFVPFNKLDSPVETIGRLETLKQIQHGRHDYDPSKLEAPPRPPTPSEADMKKDADAKKTEFRTLIAELPKDECRFCKGDSGYPVRKIKRLDDTPLCWGCVFRNFHAEAELAWDGK